MPLLTVFVCGPSEGDQRAGLTSLDDPRLEMTVAESLAELVAGLESLKGTGHVMFLDPRDTFACGARQRILSELEAHQACGLIYGDHDTSDEKGTLHPPFHKPGWSPDRLQTQMYLGRAAAYRSDLVLAALQFGAGVDGSLRLHDLALRVSEHSPSVLHVPQILLHQAAGAAAGSFLTNEVRAESVTDHLRRTGVPGLASHAAGSDVIAVEPRLEETPLVSLVIPTAGTKRIVKGANIRLVDKLISSIEENTSYPYVEVLVVGDRRAQALVGDGLQARTSIPVRFVVNDRPFNFAQASNRGAAHASGEVLIFVNDDIEVTQADWLQRMVMRLHAPGIGAVGPKLLFGNGTLQHVGVWGRHGLAGHRYYGLSADHPGSFGALGHAQTCVAVTGACLGVLRRNFLDVGGFAECFPLHYNDHDLCLKLSLRGLRSVVDPGVTLTHFELSTRLAAAEDWEVSRFKERWDLRLVDHELDNPNLVGQWIDEFPAPSSEYTAQRQGAKDPARFSARLTENSAR